MKKFSFLATLTFLPLAAAASARDNDPRPNIILILADDVGYGQLGSYGQQLMQTPRIDQMAAEGLRFTRFYAGAPSCLPSRGTLMSGLHMGHTRVRNNGSGGGNHEPIHEQDICVSTVLQHAGYLTGMMGKWALGDEFIGNNVSSKNLDGSGAVYKHGWDFYIGEPNQTYNADYYPSFLYRYDPRGLLGPASPVNELVSFPMADDPETPDLFEDYTMDLYTRTALDFIDAAKDQPFFLYVPYTAIHNNREVPELEPYTESQSWPAGAKVMASMLTRMDRDVGRILDRLAAHGIAENTLVIFTSDNGADAAWWNNIFDNNGGLAGSKHFLTEGGLRVPLIARWPGTIAPGRESAEKLAFWDFMPTLSELAGITAPEPTDGISFVPTLLDRPSQRSHDYLFFYLTGGHYPSGGHYIVRGEDETRSDSEIIEAAFLNETVVSGFEPRFTVTAPSELFGPDDPLPEAPAVIELHENRPVFGLHIPDGVAASLMVSEDLETWHDPDGWLVAADVVIAPDGREERRFELAEPVADRLFVRSSYTRYQAPMLVPETGDEPDTTPPTGTGSTIVTEGGNLVLWFDEAVTKGTGSIVIRLAADDSVVETIDVDSAAVVISGSGVTITPATSLTLGTSYYVEIASGVFEDLAGNSFAGFSGSSAWSFTVTEASLLLAYHDFGATTDEESTGFITTHQSGASNASNNALDTSAKALIDYTTGEITGVQFSINRANGMDSRSPDFTRPPAPGTPADPLFNVPGLNLDNGMIYVGNAVSGGDRQPDMTISLTGLDPGLTYDLALYGDRNISADGAERFTLGGADAATNASSTGIIDTFTTDMETRPNATAGNIARWTGINPGADGTITILVDPDPADANTTNIAYLSALRLAAAAP